MRVTRCPQIGDSQFFACVAMLVDSLSGRLHAATVRLHRKAANRKGSASACDLTLDTHRCGAWIVLDRWDHTWESDGPQRLPNKGSSVKVC